jgi:glycosyltransferase involved in cell wall biosynthesis
MVILLQTTGRLGTIPGGIQRQTETLGFDHDNSTNPDLKSYGGVIIANSEDQSVEQARNCLNQSVKYAWWPVGWKKRDEVLGRDSTKNVEFLQKHAHVIIAQSRTELNDLNHSKAVIIPPAVDEVFQNISPNRIFVHTNGRYCPFKRQEFVLKLCQDLQLPCITAGYEQNADYFKICSEYNGIVLGLQTPEQLNEIYNKTRIYVCASLSECNSGSVHEAVACGCCVLADGRNHFGVQDWDKRGVKLYYSDSECRQLLDDLYQNPEPQENSVVYQSTIQKMFFRLFTDF